MGTTALRRIEGRERPTAMGRLLLIISSSKSTRSGRMLRFSSICAALHLEAG